MATLEPQGNNDNNNEMLGEEHRNKVIASLPLMKQFTIRQQIKNADALTREQAIEMLKEAIVHIAQKDAVFLELMKSSM